MASANVTFKTEDTIKEKAKEIFLNYGLDMSSGLNLLLHAVIREEDISFATDTQKPSQKYIAWMKTKLEKSWEERKDPNTEWFTLDQIKARHNL